jgi:hypothetical protein
MEGYGSKNTGKGSIRENERGRGNKRRILLRDKLDCPLDLEVRSEVSKTSGITAGLIARCEWLVAKQIRSPGMGCSRGSL